MMLLAAGQTAGSTEAGGAYNLKKKESPSADKGLVVDGSGPAAGVPGTGIWQT